MPQYLDAGVFADYQKLLKPWVPFTVSKQGWAMTPKLSTIRNTIVTCTLCRGNRINYARGSDGIIKLVRCFQCGGSGTVDQRDMTP